MVQVLLVVGDITRPAAAMVRDAAIGIYNMPAKSVIDAALFDRAWC